MLSAIRLSFIILASALWSCSSNDGSTPSTVSVEDENRKPTIENGIEIRFDTVSASTQGRLRRVVLHKNRFYCLFESSREHTSAAFKKMMIIDASGNFVEDIFLHEGIQKLIHYNLVIHNDSLFLKQRERDEKTFALVNYPPTFLEVKKRNFSIYKDSSYTIYSTCNGEWGGTIFFEDRETKEVFETSSTCPLVVNKINDIYYVTNYMGHMQGFTDVVKIPDPTKLHASALEFETKTGSRYVEGAERVLDTIGFRITTSFVLNGELLHLYSDDDATYIGKIENGNIIPTLKFDFRFYAHFNHFYEYRTQILNWNSNDSNDKGILTISEGIFTFYVMKGEC